MTGSNGTGLYAVDPVWWVLEHSCARGSTRLVLVALAGCANYRKCITFPSSKRLMLLTKLSRSQVYFHLRKLCATGEIEMVGFDRSTGEHAYHLGKFCENGKRNTVRFPGMACPQALSYQRPANTVREPAYIKEREEEEGEAIRETGQGCQSEGAGLRIPPAVIRKERGANGHGKLRGADLLEYNLRILAQTN